MVQGGCQPVQLMGQKASGQEVSPLPPKEQNTLGTLIFNTLKLKGACSRGSFVQEQDPSTKESDAVP